MNLLTRRFPTILGLLLLILGAIGGYWYITNNKPQVPGDITPSKVRITNTSDSKFTVSWVTPQSAPGYIEYGTVGDKITQIARDDRDTESTSGSYLTHHVTVSGLQPETQYAFRIVSGDNKNRFDNNGSPYSVATGPSIPQTPTARSFYGDIAGSAGQTVTGVIVYLTLPGAAPASTLVTSSSNYSFALSTIRTSDLSKYIEYDTQATVANLTLESGSLSSTVTVTTGNSAPVPKITLGQNADYRNAEVPPVAQVEPGTTGTPEPTIAASPAGVTPGIFNVEPLSGSENRNGSGTVTLLNPQKEGEQLATKRPEFRGTGPKNLVLSVSIQSSKPYSDTVTIAQDGTWDWTPPADLPLGEKTITVSYIDTNSTEQKISRKFSIVNALTAGDPAIVATPSASLKASSSPKVSPSPVVAFSPAPSGTSSASPLSSTREAMPATESGVPVSGILTPTLLTGTIGLVIMVLGALLLAL